MDDRIRACDADRDHVTARLREHFAAGRLTADELDERISAALKAKTHGELRPLMADLPEPVPTAPRAIQRPYPAAAPWVVRRRGPRFPPVIVLALLAALLLPGEIVEMLSPAVAAGNLQHTSELELQPRVLDVGRQREGTGA